MTRLVVSPDCSQAQFKEVAPFPRYQNQQNVNEDVISAVNDDDVFYASWYDDSVPIARTICSLAPTDSAPRCAQGNETSISSWIRFKHMAWRAKKRQLLFIENNDDGPTYQLHAFDDTYPFTYRGNFLNVSAPVGCAVSSEVSALSGPFVDNMADGIFFYYTCDGTPYNGFLEVPLDGSDRFYRKLQFISYEFNVQSWTPSFVSPSRVDFFLVINEELYVAKDAFNACSPLSLSCLTDANARTSPLVDILSPPTRGVLVQRSIEPGNVSFSHFLPNRPLCSAFDGQHSILSGPFLLAKH